MNFCIDFSSFLTFLDFICTGVPHTNSSDCNAVIFYICPYYWLAEHKDSSQVMSIWSYLEQVLNVVGQRLFCCFVHCSQDSEVNLANQNLRIFNLIKSWFDGFLEVALFIILIALFCRMYIGWVCVLYVFSPHVHTVCHVRYISNLYK